WKPIKQMPALILHICAGSVFLLLAENFKPMWQLLGSGYTGLPDERLDASSLGCRNAKKKVSNPLPGVARRERPIADLDWSLGMMRCGPLDRTFAASAT
ncbi:MAG: hypothetical protein QNK98_13725, partial [Yoonia sp.]